MCFLHGCIRFGFHSFYGWTAPSKVGTSSDDFCLQPTAPTNHSAKMSKPLMDTFAWISKSRKDGKVLKHPAIKRNTHAFCFQPIHPNHLGGFASRNSARGNSQSQNMRTSKKGKSHVRKSLKMHLLYTSHSQAAESAEFRSWIWDQDKGRGAIHACIQQVNTGWVLNTSASPINRLPRWCLVFSTRLDHGKRKLIKHNIHSPWSGISIANIIISSEVC